MWTVENRGQYNRDQLRYPSDVTDEEWAEIASLIPPARRGGRKRSVNIREVFNGLLYVLSTGCQWRAIPKDCPPRSTIFDYFARWHVALASLLRRSGLSKSQAQRRAEDALLTIQGALVLARARNDSGIFRRALT